MIRQNQNYQNSHNIWQIAEITNWGKAEMRKKFVLGSVLGHLDQFSSIWASTAIYGRFEPVGA